MKKLVLAVAAIGLGAFVSPALAADLVIEDEDVPVTEVSSGDWDGVYLGGFAGVFPNDPSWFLGAQIGFNFMPAESFLIGIQASGLVSPDGGFAEGWLDVHAGFAMDMFALYGIAGVGANDSSDTFYRVGVGAEVKVADNFSIFAEGYLSEDFGDIPDVPAAAAGFRFHF